MKKIAFALAAVGICGISNAQVVGSTTDLSLSGFSVKGGVVFPLDSDFRDFAKSLTSIGVEYRLPTSFVPGGETSLSADFWLKSFNGGKGSVTALLINQKFFMKVPEGGRKTYLVGGLGFSIVDINSSNTVFTLKGGAGIDLSDNVFVEGALFLSEKGQDSRINSLGLFIGYRF